MKLINDFQKLIALSKSAEAAGETMFVRWSRGPALDKKQGTSLDQTNYQRHVGLSAQHIRHDDPSLCLQMLSEYKMLRRKDEKIYGWIFTGQQNGIDSDNAPTVDAESIKPVAKIGEELVKKSDDLRWAWHLYRTGRLSISGIDSLEKEMGVRS